MSQIKSGCLAACLFACSMVVCQVMHIRMAGSAGLGKFAGPPNQVILGIPCAAGAAAAILLLAQQ